MKTVSEKTIYAKEVEDILAKIDAEKFLWGEELYKTKIIVYPGKIKEVPGYEIEKKNLINVGIVYLDLAKGKYIKTSIVRCNWEKELLYIAECDFNAIWRCLRKSVDLGIRIQREKGEELHIKKAEDIIDISLLQRRRSCAIIKHGKIKYVTKELPPEYIKAQAKKQSSLDNYKNKYFYDITAEVYHDKSCECIKSIDPVNFRFSEVLPEYLKPCRKCRRKIYLREVCYPYVKIIPIVDHYLSKSGIMNYQLEKYAYDFKLKFRYDTPNELIVKGKEDTWIIKGFDENLLVLWHNNYVKTGPNERYITNGFHKQGLEGKNIYLILEYVNDYTYAKHLEAAKPSEQPEIEITNDEIREVNLGVWSRVTTFTQQIYDKLRSFFH